MLKDCRIVVPESRELDLFAGMLERQGAVAIRCPLVTIRDVEEPEAVAAVEAWLGRLAAGEHDDLVLFTGEGVTRLFDFARRAGIEAAVIAGFRRARTIVRGPKPTRALRQAGLSPDIVAEEPTTDGLVGTLSRLDLARRRIGVQLYPDSSDTLLAFLDRAGAQADPVLCYRYASDEEDARVAEVIGAMAAGRVDLIAFTSTPQIRRLQEVARKRQAVDELGRAMQRTKVAAVGPVTAEAVEKAGWRVDIVPTGSFHLKPFVNELAAALRGASPGEASGMR